MTNELKGVSDEDLDAASAYWDLALQSWVERMRHRAPQFANALDKALAIDDEKARRSSIKRFNDGPCRFGELDYEDETRGGHVWVNYPADEGARR